MASPAFSKAFVRSPTAGSGAQWAQFGGCPRSIAKPHSSLSGTRITILPPGFYNAYSAPFNPKSTNFETYTGPLPEILSDRFGWQEMVEGFATRYNALPPDVRSQTAIFCSNYGEAGAVTVLGPKYGLPSAISGHQNFYFWGYQGFTGDSVLTLGSDAKNYTDKYEQVIDLGPFDSPWTMDHEHLRYFWLRHRKVPYSQGWPSLKYWY